jgi:hypothetical protein
MNTLADAWAWYQGTKLSLRLVERLADKHWGSWDPAGGIARDDYFLNVEPGELGAEVRSAEEHLDDFAVFVLFSVFEAEVRTKVLDDTHAERQSVTHPSLAYWMRQAKTAIEEGSFFRVLEGFKSPGLNDLIEQVNQVRRYRNWVAHDRRDEPAASVSPDVAYDRLRRFLEALSPPPAA